ncbi:MAG: extracellular solute-binding protein [Deltaproteobacteria bacterium]|nr:extracellular solute-binding protein [Deltaproteobacteria bacterium]
MRRGLVIGGLAVATLSCLSRLGQAAEVVLWHSYRAGEMEALDRTVDRFRHEHPDTKVRVLAVPYGAYQQKLISAIPAGHGPDLFIAAHDQLGDMIRRELIEPVPAALASAQFLDETLRPLAVGAVQGIAAGAAGPATPGRSWGWPMAFKTLVLFYRTDLVATPPATTDGMIEIAHALTRPGRFGLAYNLAEFYFHAPWYFGSGAELLSADGLSARIESEAAAASGAFLRRLVLEERVVPTDANGALVTEMFNRGQVAMVVNGPWFISEIDRGVPWKIATLPRMSASDRPARPLLTVEGLFVAKGRATPETVGLAEALVSDSAARIRALEGGQPVANRAAYDDPEVAARSVLGTFRAQLEQTVPMPTAPLVALLWEPLNEALRQISRGALAPKVAFAAAASRVRVLNQPLPESESAAPFVLGLLLLLCGALAVAVWRRPPRFVARLLAARAAYAFLLPTAIGMTLLVAVPFLMGLGLGFFAFGPGEVRFVGFANFVSIITAAEYPVTHPLSFYFTLVVTVLWTVANVLLHVGIGFALALLLSPAWLKGRGLFRVLLILPWTIPNYITALVFKGLFNAQFGAVNAVLVALGLSPVGWFDGFWPAFAANVVTNVWLGFPFMMVTLLGALQAIPQDLYDAARVDGAGAWQRFVGVTLPQVGPALLPAVILGTIWTFNMFNIVFLVSEGQPEGSTDILVTEAYRWAFVRNGRYGYAAAYSTIIFVILVLYSLVTRRLVAPRSEARV